jgi:PEP-CTERM motif-containing protein
MPSQEAGFGSFAPGVLFDAVVVLSENGGTGSFILDFANGGTITPLPSADVTFSGATINAFVPGADLISSAENGSQYMVNLWTRQGITGGTNQIAEFAPANSDAPITVTPEPASLGFLGLALAGLVTLARRRQHA